jgi:hypothetical protein
MTPGDSGVYELQHVGSVDAGRIFEPGAVLVASASGAVVPAFSGEQVVGPSDVVLTRPAIGPVDSGADSAPASGYTIDTSVDLQLTWTGGEAGTTAIVEFFSESATVQTVMECTFDATVHQATIPKEVIATFAGVANVEYVAGAFRFTSFQAGTFATTLEAFTAYEGPAAFF